MDEHASDKGSDGPSPEPRWPALVAVLAVGGLYTALPKSLAVGPRWLQLVIVCVLLVPTMISHRTGRHRMTNLLGQLITAVMTVFMIASQLILSSDFSTDRAWPPG